MNLKVKKSEAVAAIIANSVYLPESGKMKSLANALGRLSLADLDSLKLVIAMKIDDVEIKSGTYDHR